MTRMAANTTEFTTQVAPKSSAIWTTPRVSSSMKPAPRKNIRPLGRTRRTGAKIERISTDKAAMRIIPVTLGLKGMPRCFR